MVYLFIPLLLLWSQTKKINRVFLGTSPILPPTFSINPHQSFLEIIHQTKMLFNNLTFFANEITNTWDLFWEMKASPSQDDPVYSPQLVWRWPLSDWHQTDTCIYHLLRHMANTKSLIYHLMCNLASRYIINKNRCDGMEKQPFFLTLSTRTGLAVTLDLVTFLGTFAHSISTFSSHLWACPYLWLKRWLASPITECTTSDSCDPADQAEVGVKLGTEMNWG